MEVIRKRGRSVSYRINADILDAVIKEARLRKITPNILVNNVLRRFIEFEKYRENLEIMPVPKKLLVDLMEAADDRMIKHFAEKTFRILNNAVIFMRKQQDLESFLYVLKLYLEVSVISFDHTVSGSMHTIALRHDMGLKWSEFAKELISIICEKLVGKRADFELTDCCLIATMELPEGIDKQLIA